MENTTKTTTQPEPMQFENDFMGHRITRFWVMNTYLVRDDDGFTLIDTGMSGSGNSILKAAQRLGQPIRRILLTHAHSDHVGSLDELVQQLPDVEFICSPQTARFLQGDLSLEPDQADVPLKGGFVQCQAVPTRTVAHGDSVGSL